MTEWTRDGQGIARRDEKKSEHFQTTSATLLPAGLGAGRGTCDEIWDDVRLMMDADFFAETIDYQQTFLVREVVRANLWRLTGVHANPNKKRTCQSRSDKIELSVFLTKTLFVIIVLEIRRIDARGSSRNQFCPWMQAVQRSNIKAEMS